MNEVDIYLAHDRENDENHERVSLINSELQNLGYKTYFDEERKTDMDQICQGISNTKFIFVFISKSYAQRVGGYDGRDPYKMEFIYGREKRGVKFIVPVAMEDSVKTSTEWPGQLGMTLCNVPAVEMWFDFEDNPQKFKATMKKLTTKIDLQLNKLKSMDGAFTIRNHVTGRYVLQTDSLEYVKDRCCGGYEKVKAFATDANYNNYGLFKQAKQNDGTIFIWNTTSGRYMGAPFDCPLMEQGHNSKPILMIDANYYNDAQWQLIDRPDKGEGVCMIKNVKKGWYLVAGGSNVWETGPSGSYGKEEVCITDEENNEMAFWQISYLTFDDKIIAPVTSVDDFVDKSNIDIYLAHDREDDENHKRVSLINSELKNLGYKTYFDEERRGDMDQMYHGINSTKLIMVLVSENYAEKVGGYDGRDPYKMEFIYGREKRGPKFIVPVAMEDSVKRPTEWPGQLGMTLCNELAVRMCFDFEDNTNDFEEGIDDLKTQIDMRLKKLESMDGAFTIRNHVTGRYIIQKDSLEYIKDRYSGGYGNTKVFASEANYNNYGLFKIQKFDDGTNFIWNTTSGRYLGHGPGVLMLDANYYNDAKWRLIDRPDKGKGVCMFKHVKKSVYLTAGGSDVWNISLSKCYGKVEVCSTDKEDDEMAYWQIRFLTENDKIKDPITTSDVFCVKTDLFLTHDWGRDENNVSNHSRVSRVNEELQKLGYKTWFDEDKMTGNIVDQMRQGIDYTKVVLVFVTQRYTKKIDGDDGRDNCKLEFNYAHTKLGPKYMIPINMERRMDNQSEWPGTLQMILGDRNVIQMSFSFKTEQQRFESAIKELKSELDVKLDHINFMDGAFTIRNYVTGRYIVQKDEMVRCKTQWISKSNKTGRYGGPRGFVSDANYNNFGLWKFEEGQFAKMIVNATSRRLLGTGEKYIGDSGESEEKWGPTSWLFLLENNFYHDGHWNLMEQPDKGDGIYLIQHRNTKRYLFAAGSNVRNSSPSGSFGETKLLTADENYDDMALWEIRYLTEKEKEEKPILSSS